MAPDLNSLNPSHTGTTKGYHDYSEPGSTGYHIPQNLTWMDPNNRKIRVLTIGAGISGILMAYQIQKQCENVEHVLYEKNEDIGG